MTPDITFGDVKKVVLKGHVSAARINKNFVVLTFSLKMPASIIGTVTSPKEMSDKQVRSGFVRKEMLA